MEKHNEIEESLADLDGPAARELRQSLGLTRFQFYHPLGICQTSQCRYERGERGLSERSLKRIRDGFAAVLTQRKHDELIRRLGESALEALQHNAQEEQQP